MSDVAALDVTPADLAPGRPYVERGEREPAWHDRLAIGLWFWLQAAGSLSRWIITLGGVVIGGVIYGAGVMLLRVPEVQMLTGAIARRLLRRASSQ